MLSINTWTNITIYPHKPKMSGLAPNIVTLATNRTNLGLFKISFSTFWLTTANLTYLEPSMTPTLFPITSLRASDKISSLTFRACSIYNRDFTFRPKLAKNGTDPTLYKINFRTFCLGEPNVLEKLILKKSQISIPWCESGRVCGEIWDP